jgi:hypothetical protein
MNKYSKILIIILILILVGSILFFVFKDSKNSIIEDKKYCLIDSDCVPASCCHANELVNKEYAPNCEGVVCSLECSGLLDCGEGKISCINNQCEIVSN